MSKQNAAKVGVVAVSAAFLALVSVIVLPSAANGRQDRPAGAPLLHASAVDAAQPRGHRLTRVVDGVRFTFKIPQCCWEQGPATARSRDGKLLISLSTVGPQGAEAVVFWTSFPGGERAHPCGNLTGRRIGPSSADLLAAVATAPGTKPLTRRSRVTIDGRPAQHVVLKVRKDVGCDPGFFYTWRPRGPHGYCGGACWLESSAGDTIRVWIIQVGGTRLVLEAQTTWRAGQRAKREIRKIVESIRFDCLCRQRA